MIVPVEIGFYLVFGIENIAFERIETELLLSTKP